MCLPAPSSPYSACSPSPRFVRSRFASARECHISCIAATILLCRRAGDVQRRRSWHLRHRGGHHRIAVRHLRHLAYRLLQVPLTRRPRHRQQLAASLDSGFRVGSSRACLGDFFLFFERAVCAVNDICRVAPALLRLLAARSGASKSGQQQHIFNAGECGGSPAAEPRRLACAGWGSRRNFCCMVFEVWAEEVCSTQL